MKSVYIGLLASLVTSIAGQAGNNDNATEAAIHQIQQELPSCAIQCLETILPENDCQLTDTTCTCSNANVTSATEACVAESCTIREALATKRFQSESCGLPVRSQTGKLLTVTWTLWGLSFFSVVLRFVARSPIMNGAGVHADDWTILGCLITTIPGSTVLTLMAENGLGKDTWTLKPDQITAILFYFWIDEFLYMFSMMGIKISILLLYLRIFPSSVSKGFRVICFTLIGALSLMAIASNLSTAFECDPVANAWLRWDGEHPGQCINIQIQIFSTAAINIVSDLVVFFLPIPRLLKLNISTRQKVGLCATFLVGLFVTVCSIIRLQYLARWGESTNPAWQYTPIALWSTIECSVGVFCACMPPMAGPIKKFWSATIGSLGSRLTSRGSAIREVRSSRLPSDPSDRCDSARSQSHARSKGFGSSVHKARSLDDLDELELVGKAPSPDSRV